MEKARIERLEKEEATTLSAEPATNTVDGGETAGREPNTVGDATTGQATAGQTRPHLGNTGGKITSILHLNGLPL